MNDAFARFDRLVRRAGQYTEARTQPRGGPHPFEERDIHPGLPPEVKKLFDDGHYAQATFEAYKFLDREVQRLSGSTKSGTALMLEVFALPTPTLKLTPLSNVSEQDEQKGFQFLFSGSLFALRNPRGHERVVDTPDRCLDHLGLASLLLRRLEEAGLK